MTITSPLLDIKINEEYSKLVPKFSEPEFQSLKESIKLNGLHYAIAVNKDNVLLDGHHRYRACQELNIQPKVEVQEFVDLAHEQLFVIEMATHRRQLNSFQRCELALKLKPILQEIAKRNESLGGKGVKCLAPLGRVDQEIGKRAGVSYGTITKVETILEKGTEEQIQKLRNGKASIHTEHKFMIYQERRRQLIVEGEKSSQLLDSLFSENNRLKLLLGDMKNEQNITSQIPDSSIDCIFTDPPYAKEYLPLYADLAKLAVDKLKEGGSLITYSGSMFHPQILDYLKHPNLHWNWMIIVLHTGGIDKVFSHNIMVKYKPLLWYVKDTRPPNPNIYDVIESEPAEKDFHKWEQSPIEAEYIISKLTVENQVIFDPFMGGATTALAALKLNRKFIGIEINKDSYNIAKSRIAEFLNLQ